VAEPFLVRRDIRRAFGPRIAQSLDPLEFRQVEYVTAEEVDGMHSLDQSRPSETNTGKNKPYLQLSPESPFYKAAKESVRFFDRITHLPPEISIAPQIVSKSTLFLDIGERDEDR